MLPRPILLVRPLLCCVRLRARARVRCPVRPLRSRVRVVWNPSGRARVWVFCAAVKARRVWLSCAFSLSLSLLASGRGG